VDFLGKILGRRRREDAVRLLRERHQRFRELIARNNRVLELIADAEEKLSGEFIFDRQYLRDLAAELAQSTRSVVYSLNAITDNSYPALSGTLEAIDTEVEAVIEDRVLAPDTPFVIPLAEASNHSTDATGEKMARLGELRSKQCCRTPDGFVISAAAYQRLWDEVAAAADLGDWLELPADCEESALEEAAAHLQKHLAQARLPEDLARAIRAAVAALEKEHPGTTLAVRSSALGEDGVLSFAGQYRTLLGVPPAEVLSAYLDVLVSLYSPEAMRYRHHNRMPPARGLMAVGCLCMVDAQAAGVLYTLDPAQPQREVLLVTACHGLGKLVVEGTGGTDRFVLSRARPHEVMSRSVARKEWQYALRPGGGIERVPVPPAQVAAPSLSDAHLSELAALGLRIEAERRGAQDIEWALDREGKLIVLQARPLRLAPQGEPVERDFSSVGDQHPVLLRRRGEVACRGIAHGRVCLIEERTKFDELPAGAVLVARHSKPILAAVLAKASAVITDIGTATGHLATIARELRVPTIVDTETATQVLRDGQEVTVDAEENVVYEGRVKELVHYGLLASASYQDALEFRLLRRMLRSIAPLHLRDPDSPHFSAEACTTYHDVIRFAHEKAVQELTTGQSLRATGRSEEAHQLELAVPLDLLLIDLGGGLEEGVTSKSVQPDQVLSLPLRALVEGLSAEGVWNSGPADMDLDGLMASATRASLTGPLTPPPRHNLALISTNYLNLNLKLGYHFNTVACYLSEQRNDNFIHFRFAGGVTEMTRRARRAEILQQILERYDFVVERTGDLVIGSVKKVSADAMVERMQMIGRLIGFTRQLDVFLRDEDRVEQCVNGFMKGEYNPTPRCLEMKTLAEVLVLDDESIVCERLKDYLEKSGYLVETFGDSQQAIERLQEKRFDVVISDLKMKGPTGLDIMHCVRRQNRGTQVIIITGYATMEAAREAEYCDVADFILKPLQLEHLGAAVKKAARKAARLRKRADQ